MLKPRFQITVNGQNSKRYIFKNKPKARITQSFGLEMDEARRFSGLSIADFDALPGNPKWIFLNDYGYSKAHIIALYRQSRLLESIQNDVQTKGRRP